MKAAKVANMEQMLQRGLKWNERCKGGQNGMEVERVPTWNKRCKGVQNGIKGRPKRNNLGILILRSEAAVSRLLVSLTLVHPVSSWPAALDRWCVEQD